MKGSLITMSNVLKLNLNGSTAEYKDDSATQVGASFYNGFLGAIQLSIGSLDLVVEGKGSLSLSNGRITHDGLPFVVVMVNKGFEISTFVFDPTEDSSVNSVSVTGGVPEPTGDVGIDVQHTVGAIISNVKNVVGDDAIVIVVNEAYNQWDAPARDAYDNGFGFGEFEGEYHIVAG